MKKGGITQIVRAIQLYCEVVNLSHYLTSKKYYIVFFFKQCKSLIEHDKQIEQGSGQGYPKYIMNWKSLSNQIKILNLIRFLVYDLVFRETFSSDQKIEKKYFWKYNLVFNFE